MKKSVASMHSGVQSLHLRHNAIILQRAANYADVPRSLASHRGIMIAAALSLAFWAGVFEAIF